MLFFHDFLAQITHNAYVLPEFLFCWNRIFISTASPTITILTRFIFSFYSIFEFILRLSIIILEVRICNNIQFDFPVSISRTGYLSVYCSPEEEGPLTYSRLLRFKNALSPISLYKPIIYIDPKSFFIQ